MTTKEKELLLKDLCARLPYGVKAHTKLGTNITVEGVIDGIVKDETEDSFDISFIKPYLRPMSDMTDEEKYQYEKTQWEYQAEYCAPEYFDGLESYDWLNAHHIDYRQLIEQGLALEAPVGMYDIK